jgi:hypothetical protein
MVDVPPRPTMVNVVVLDILETGEQSATAGAASCLIWVSNPQMGASIVLFWDAFFGVAVGFGGHC